MPKVSIIVPVYNVEEYLDRCVETLVNQTFKDIEIILIDDGSTDSSGFKCLEWAKKDDRIVFVSKKNEKQGPSRNLGVKIAKGDYLMFADSDDWIELNMAEKMYNCITENECDIVLSDIYLIYNGEKIEVIKEPILSNKVVSVYDEPSLIYTIRNPVWNKIYKKELFLNNNIEQSQYFAEDMAVNMKLIMNAKRICQIKEPFYYYFKQRQGNSSGDNKNFLEFLQSLDIIYNYFEENNLMDKFYELLKMKFVKNSFEELERAKKMCLKEVYKDIEEKYYEYLDLRFPNWKNKLKNVVLFGSYNLRMIIHYCGYTYDKNLLRYSYNSVISAMSQKLNIEEDRVDYPNSYKKNSVLNDLNKKFVSKLENDNKNIDYIFIDFLEERYPVAKIKNTYLTVSEVFEEMKIQLDLGNLEIIGEEEKFGIWKEKCLEFIIFLKKYFKPNQIILVETKLMEKYGINKSNSELKEYENIEKIMEINKYLEKCYKFFKENFEGINIIELENSELNFTDSEFNYGVFPYHMNSSYYFLLSNRIINCLNCQVNRLL